MSDSSNKAALWGDEQVVEVGWNVTHMGHYLKPDRRIKVEIGEGGALLANYRGKPEPLAEVLDKLTGDDGPSRLCRVWLITDAGKQHCCWYYGGGYNKPATDIDREMVEHFSGNARRQPAPPVSATRSPSP